MPGVWLKFPSTGDSPPPSWREETPQLLVTSACAGDAEARSRIAPPQELFGDHFRSHEGVLDH